MRPEQLHQKLGLVQQLKTLARQHEQVLQAYERKVQEKLQEGALAATSGGKRAGPPLGADGPEAKRHRQLAERASRKNELWNEVVKMVEKIRKNAKSEAFRQPVDPIKLKIPDYLNVITKPMDLGTVLKKLRSKPMGYTQPQEVADDVRQIWINCRTYNGENHPITLAANTCSEAFEKAWGQANIEQRWEVEMMREQREEQAFAGGEAEAGDDTIVNQLRYKRNMLGDLIAAKDVQDNLPPGSLGDLAPDRDMTFEEKRKLSAHMASLPGEKLVAVLDIISEGENIQHDGEGEVEVDIDALHNNTLWKLKAYVDGVLTATSGPPPKKTANRGPAPNKQGPPAAAAGGGGMPPPPPPGAAAAVGGQPGLAPPAAPQQQQPLQPPQQRPGAGAMLPPPQQQPPQSQPPQPMQPPPKQPPQQAPGSPQHSGGVSAQEVVGSTAGGPGAARSHQFTYDMGTVAQSGTNARPSNFVMGKARQPTPTADAAGTAAAGKHPAQAGPTHMDAGTAEQWEAALKDGTTAGDAAAAPAAAAAAAAGAADAAAGTTPAGEAAPAPAAAPDDAKPAPPAPAAAAAAGGAAAADAAPAAADAKPVGDAAAAAGPAAAAADAPAAPPAEAPAALEAAAAAPTAAAAEALGTAPAAPAAAPAAEGAPAAAPAEEPAAAAVAGAPAAGDGSGAPEESSEWEKFQEIAKQQEDEIAKKKEEEQRRKEEAEEQKRLKAEQEQQKQQQEKDARAAEIFRSMGGAGGGAAAANDAAVHADVEKLLKAAPPPPAAGAAAAAAAGDGPAAMDVDSDSEKQQQEEDDEEDDGLPADGGGFD